MGRPDRTIDLGPGDDAPGSAAPSDPLAEVVAVLREALLALGRAGQPVEANRLAATAWSRVRHDAPELAERINRTMHVLARLETRTTPEGEQP